MARYAAYPFPTFSKNFEEICTAASQKKMQGNVRNLPAHQHSDNAFCNPHAKWAYNRTVFHCCTIADRGRKKISRKYGKICLPTCDTLAPGCGKTGALHNADSPTAPKEGEKGNFLRKK